MEVFSSSLSVLFSFFAYAAWRIPSESSSVALYIVGEFIVTVWSNKFGLLIVRKCFFFLRKCDNEFTSTSCLLFIWYSRMQFPLIHNVSESLNAGWGLWWYCIVPGFQTDKIEDLLFSEQTPMPSSSDCWRWWTLPPNSSSIILPSVFFLVQVYLKAFESRLKNIFSNLPVHPCVYFVCQC